MNRKCNRCGKILYPTKYGFTWLTCDDCLTNSERYFRKKREQRLDDAILKYETEKMYAR